MGNNEISIESIKNKLAPPLEVMPLGYTEFNIRDFEMFPGFEDSGEWFYENHFTMLFSNNTSREAADSVLRGYGLDARAVKLLTDAECSFLKERLFDPMCIRENVEIGYGVPEGYNKNEFRFLKVMFKYAQ